MSRHVPRHIVKAACEVYKANPELTATQLLAAYDATDNLDAKLAFEVVGELMMKKAGIKGVVGEAAMHTAMGGTMAALKDKANKNNLMQGTQTINTEGAN